MDRISLETLDDTSVDACGVAGNFLHSFTEVEPSLRRIRSRQSYSGVGSRRPDR